MERRVTIRDIGKAMGCHHTTVSLALRNDPRLAAATRSAIQQKAKEMGYAPDPMVKALMNYRNASRPHAVSSVLAWLSGDATPRWGPDYPWQGYVIGAQARAAELGYRVEEFMLGAKGMSPRRMSEILRARGIQGVLVPPQPRESPPAAITLDWQAFSAVAFGYSLQNPELHVVATNHFESARMAVTHLHALGYRRIGLALETIHHQRSGGGLVGGYESEVANSPRLSRVPPLITPRLDVAALASFLKRHKPDALLVPNTRCIDWLRQDLHIDIPGTLGVVSLIGPSSKGYTHIRQQTELIGASAIDQVVGMIHVRQRGAPASPLQLLIRGVWTDGNTVRAKI